MSNNCSLWGNESCSSWKVFVTFQAFLNTVNIDFFFFALKDEQEMNVLAGIWRVPANNSINPNSHI